MGFQTIVTGSRASCLRLLEQLAVINLVILDIFLWLFQNPLEVLLLKPASATRAFLTQTFAVFQHILTRYKLLSTMTAAYAPPTTLGGLRDYVTGSSSMQNAADSTVQMFISHNHLKAKFPEIRLDKHVSLASCT
jgi:hypothetical protein